MPVLQTRRDREFAEDSSTCAFHFSERRLLLLTMYLRSFRLLSCLASGARVLAACALALSPALASCARPMPATPAVDPVTPSVAHLSAHLAFLSDDLLEGRGIGTRGGRIAASYIESVFRAAGLSPAFGQSFRQAVPLVAFASDPSASIVIGGGDSTSTLSMNEDFAGVNLRVPGGILQGEPLFVGYAIQSASRKWDDFKGVDVRGRLLIAFANEPGRGDPKVFLGKTLTAHGRWTTKFELAAKLGAAGMLLIHTPDDVGYGWEVTRGSWQGETFRLADSPSLLPFQGWVTEAAGRKLLAAAGLDYADLRRRMERPDFAPIPIPVSVSIHAKHQSRNVPGINVVGKLSGDGDKAIILSAHYDHLGLGRAVQGDEIYNGALDNGAALSLLLALAQSYAHSPRSAHPTLLFAAVDAEEEGLLGSQYYARHPAIPLDKTLFGINFELSNVWGKTHDVLARGAECAGFDAVLREVLSPMGLVLTKDPVPEQGYFFRSDQYSFARMGVPAIWLDGGSKYIGKPPSWGDQVRAKYRADDYHRPSDQVKPDWDLSGLAQLAEVTTHLVRTLGQRSNGRMNATCELLDN